MGWMPQTCIVHLIRHSMYFASWKDRKSVAQTLPTVYRAPEIFSTSSTRSSTNLEACRRSQLGSRIPRRP